MVKHSAPPLIYELDVNKLFHPLAALTDWNFDHYGYGYKLNLVLLTWEQLDIEKLDETGLHRLAWQLARKCLDIAEERFHVREYEFTVSAKPIQAYLKLVVEDKSDG